MSRRRRPGDGPQAIAGARAANALGLSTQVPAQSTYLTDGPSRRVVLGKRVVHLRHASPKHLIAPGSPVGTVVQALRHVGPVRAADVVQIAARRLSANDKKTLASTTAQAPAWMRSTLASIANATEADIDGERRPASRRGSCRSFRGDRCRPGRRRHDHRKGLLGVLESEALVRSAEGDNSRLRRRTSLSKAFGAIRRFSEASLRRLRRFKKRSTTNSKRSTGEEVNDLAAPEQSPSRCLARP